MLVSEIGVVDLEAKGSHLVSAEEERLGDVGGGDVEHITPVT